MIWGIALLAQANREGGETYTDVKRIWQGVLSRSRRSDE
jgi:hypothetical protein